MKILIIQVTRFGDILTTLPVFKALKRENPNCELHILVRKRFADAAKLSDYIDKIWELNTEQVLDPFFKMDMEFHQQLAQSFGAATELFDKLQAENFDKIVNLSFSPSSSFMTHLIATDQTEIAGYSRTSDFFLQISDKNSEFFKAQVGVDKSNRIHVIDIFGWVAGVELQESDLREPVKSLSLVQKEAGIICHLGASEGHKKWQEVNWFVLINRLCEAGYNVTLVGTKNEWALANEICRQAINKKGQIDNQVGSTNFRQLYELFKGATLFIGGDSGPMHMANLAGVKTINISVGRVRFWETGPTVKGSRVLVGNAFSPVTPRLVFECAIDMLKGNEMTSGYYLCTGLSGVRYGNWTGVVSTKDGWDLIEWIYFGGDFPKLDDEERAYCTHLLEVSEISIKVLKQLEVDINRTELVGVLDRSDQFIDLVSLKCKTLAPLAFKFLTEKGNIPPGSREFVFERTTEIYESLRSQCQRLVWGISDAKEATSHVKP